MLVSTIENTIKTMLYCPECQDEFEEGTQRFCNNDGRRLLPSPAAKPGGVFSSILNIAAVPEEKKEAAAAPQFPVFKTEKTFEPHLRLPTTSKIFKPKEDIEPKSKPVPKPSKPLPRIIRSSEISSGQAGLGDRKVNPTRRLALSWDNPKVLRGQVIKGRYHIVEMLGQDEISISYLAEDKIVAGKKVSVRVLMDEDKTDSFTGKIFAEERVSLSHVNHPNIVSVIDSGELLEGKPFVVTEYVEGISVKDYLEKNGQFNALQTARIIRQTAYALNEVHQNGVLHRNLKPENIILVINEAGAEQVKLTNFGGSQARLYAKNTAYKSPEQIGGKVANFASDEYALAIIAYQMLTNRLPFTASSETSMMRAQRKGLTLPATNLRLDLPPLVDGILEKALAFEPSERYPKARDFGDAFYNSLSTAAPWETDQEAEKIEIINEQIEEISDESKNSFVFAAQGEKKSGEKPTEAAAVKATGDLAWEKRSPEPPKTPSLSRTLLSVIGVLLLLGGVFGAWMYFLNRKAEIAPMTVVNNTIEPATEMPVQAIVAPTPREIESPPLPRSITPPAGARYFQNSKENLKGDLMKNFLGFSLYYPNSWKQNESATNFLDISKTSSAGLPIEQMIVTHYDSKGTFEADLERFPSLVKNSNEALEKFLPGYKMISGSEKTVNNGWRAYEVKFQGVTESGAGEKITVWGRRLFIPAARFGMKNGYVITMLATSLSPEVKSVDDVGVRGELSQILETFEPNQSF